MIRAVVSKNYSLAKKLLQKGESPNVQDKLGRTPLLISLDAGNLNFASELLRFNADPGVKDFSGRDAVSISPDFWEEISRSLEERKVALENVAKEPEEADTREPELFWTGKGWKPKHREFPYFVRVNRHRTCRSTGTTNLNNPLCRRGA